MALLGHNRPVYLQVSSTATVSEPRINRQIFTTKDISAAAIFPEEPLCRSPSGQSPKVYGTA